MTMTDPITPPPELLDQWCMDATLGSWRDIATQAAQWGADQELETCCLWMERNYDYPSAGHLLRAARRPKLPSLKEQALAVLDHTQKGYGLAEVDLDTIRRALEALPE